MTLETLIVDDDLVFVLIHKNLLRLSKIGSHFVSCLDGQEALQYLDKAYKEDTHYLILLDITMPVMNGWEFLELLHERYYQHEVSIIIVTSSTDASDRKRAFTYPQVIHYLEKPLTLDVCQQLMTLESVRKIIP